MIIISRCIVKKHRNLIWYILSSITYIMCSTPCIYQWCLTWRWFLSLMYLCSNFLQMWQIFAFSYDLFCSFLDSIIFFFSKLINFIGCFLNDSQNLFIQNSFCIYHAYVCTNTIPILPNISRSKGMKWNNSILTVSRIWHKKHFSWKIMHKIWWKNYSETLL